MALYRTKLSIGVDTLKDFANDDIAKSSVASADDDFEQIRFFGLRIPKEINPDCCVNDRRHDVARFARY